MNIRVIGMSEEEAERIKKEVMEALSTREGAIAFLKRETEILLQMCIDAKNKPLERQARKRLAWIEGLK